MEDLSTLPRKKATPNRKASLTSPTTRRSSLASSPSQSLSTTATMVTPIANSSSDSIAERAAKDVLATMLLADNNNSSKEEKCAPMATMSMEMDKGVVIHTVSASANVPPTNSATPFTAASTSAITSAETKTVALSSRTEPATAMRKGSSASCAEMKDELVSEEKSLPSRRILETLPADGPALSLLLRTDATSLETKISGRKHDQRKFR